MPTTTKLLFRGAATTNTATVLYTVPSVTTTIVTDVVVVNTAAAAGTFTLALAGTALATTVAIPAYDTTVIPLRQVLTAANTLTGGASAITISFHISGIELT